MLLVPKRIRTSDLQIRNLVLYPAELWAPTTIDTAALMSFRGAGAPERVGFEPTVPF